MKFKYVNLIATMHNYDITSPGANITAYIWH